MLSRSVAAPMPFTRDSHQRTRYGRASTLAEYLWQGKLARARPTTTVTKDDIRLLYEYDRWANNRVLHAASTLSPEKFTRDLGGSFRSVRDTLVHIVFGEWGWITYWKEPSPSSAFLTDLWTRDNDLFDPNAFPDLAAVQVKWVEIEREQVEFVDRVTNESLRRMLPVRETQLSLGEPFHLPSGSSRANDATACRYAARHGLRHVFDGGPPRHTRCTLAAPPPIMWQRCERGILPDFT
jgi:uncharacterized damage-inducible protein DinB